MATSIGKMNIEFGASNAELVKKAKESKSVLENVAPNNDPVGKFADGAVDDLKTLDKQAFKTQQSVEKLKKTLQETSNNKSSNLNGIDKLKDQLKDSGKDKGKTSETAKKFAEKLLDFAGVGGSGEALGAKVGGVSLANVGLGLGGALAAGQAAVNVKTAQRTSGVSGSAIGNAVLGVQQLPILKQLTEAAGEFGSAIGVDKGINKVFGTKLNFSTSDQSAELERLTKFGEQYDALRKSARDAAKENLEIDRQNARVVANLANAYEALFAGGDRGAKLAIDANAQSQYDAATDKRNAAVKAVASEKETVNKDFATNTKELTATISGRAGSPEADDAKKQLDKLTTEKNNLLKLLDQRASGADTAFKSEVAGIKKIQDAQIGILNGSLPDIKAQEDAFKNLRDTIDGLAVTDVEKLRKAFEKTNPNKGALEDYNKQLAEYDKAVKQIGIKSGIKDLELKLKFAGLEPKDQYLAAMLENGATKEQIVKAKLLLDATEAKENLKKFTDEMKNLQAQINAEKAGDNILERIKAELAVRKDLTEEQKKQLANERYQLELTKQGKSLTDSVKTAREKQIDQLNKIKELRENGAISSETADRAITAARKDFLESQKVSNPDILQKGDAATERAIASAAGLVQDGDNPQFNPQIDKTNELLEKIYNVSPKANSQI